MTRVSERGAATAPSCRHWRHRRRCGFAPVAGARPGPMDFAGWQTRRTQRGRRSDGRPCRTRSASLIERGQYLTRAADCVACHTTEGGQPSPADGPLCCPSALLYSTNITPDKKTGIGDYTDADWLRALHKGIARDGTRLYPAMPYASYTLHDGRRCAGHQGLPLQPAARRCAATQPTRFHFRSTSAG